MCVRANVRQRELSKANADWWLTAWALMMTAERLPRLARRIVPLPPT
jgi:hypothetical protein